MSRNDEEEQPEWFTGGPTRYGYEIGILFYFWLRENSLLFLLMLMYVKDEDKLNCLPTPND